MNNNYIILLILNFLLASCASRSQIVNSPLFNQQEISSKDEAMVTIPQSQSFEILEAKKKQDLDLRQNSNFITYTAKGGEKLTFVARSLLGNPHKTQLILEWNPNLKNSSLEKGTKILVKADELDPIARYLSKDVLEKNSDVLQKSFNKFKKFTSYKTAQGDTLQKISSTFYKTTRNWTLLYLFNIEVISDPDKLEIGTSIRVPQLEINSQPSRHAK